jgi:hypothetical protein
MSKPKTPPLKRPPKKAKPLTLAHVAAPLGATTLQRVEHCLSAYTDVNPIQPSMLVGDLCKTLDFLGSDLNVEFHLQGQQQYWQGEIDPKWTVQNLADYTDQKIQQNP